MKSEKKKKDYKPEMKWNKYCQWQGLYFTGIRDITNVKGSEYYCGR